MVDIEAAAAALFGSTTPVAAEAPKPEAQPIKSLAELFYPAMAQQQEEAPSEAVGENEANKTEGLTEEALAAYVATAEAVDNVAKELGFEPNALTEELSHFIHDKGLEPEAAKEMLKLHEDYSQNVWTELSQQWEQTSAQQFSSVDMQDVQQLVSDYGDDSLKEFLQAVPIANVPAINRMLLKIARELY